MRLEHTHTHTHTPTHSHTHTPSHLHRPAASKGHLAAPANGLYTYGGSNGHLDTYGRVATGGVGGAGATPMGGGGGGAATSGAGLRPAVSMPVVSAVPEKKSKHKRREAVEAAAAKAKAKAAALAAAKAAAAAAKAQPPPAPAATTTTTTTTTAATTTTPTPMMTTTTTPLPASVKRLVSIVDGFTLGIDYLTTIGLESIIGADLPVEDLSESMEPSHRLWNVVERVVCKTLLFGTRLAIPRNLLYRYRYRFFLNRGIGRVFGLLATIGSRIFDALFGF